MHIVWVEAKRLTLHGEVIFHAAVAKIIGFDFVVVIALRTENPKASIVEACDFKLAITLSATAIFKINQQKFLPYEMNEPHPRERPNWTLKFTLPARESSCKFLLQFPYGSGKLVSDAKQAE